MAAGRPRVVVVGLGPAGPEHVTAAADLAIRSAPVALLRTARHPAAAAYAGLPGVSSLDDRYEAAATFPRSTPPSSRRWSPPRSSTATSPTPCRARPRWPSTPSSCCGRSPAATTARSTSRCSRRCPSSTSPGLRLGVDPVEAGVRLVDAEHFAIELGAGSGAAGGAGPLLVAQRWSQAVLSEVKLAFETEPGRPVTLLHHLGLDDEVVIEVPWAEIDRTIAPDHLT